MLYVVLAVTLLCGAACYAVARRKGLDRTYWLIAGFLAGPLAIPFVLFARPKRSVTAPK